MAKGHRGKSQTVTSNGPDKAKTNNKAADKENSIDTQNLQMSKGITFKDYEIFTLHLP